MSYTSVKDVFEGELWGDGGVYWASGNYPIATIRGKVASSLLTKTANWSQVSFNSFAGISTSATTTVLTDTNLALVVNAYIGWYLTYLTGPAAGLSLPITANAATTITTATFGKTPTSGGGDSFQVTRFPVVVYTAQGTITSSSDGNIKWVTWTVTGGSAFE